MKIVDYRIISGNGEGDVEKKIARAIAEGWQPLGSLQVICPVLESGPAPAFFQAVVKYAG